MVLLLLLELLMVGVQGLVEEQKVLAGQTTKVGIGGAGRGTISPVAAESSQGRDSQSNLWEWTQVRRCHQSREENGKPKKKARRE